MTPFTRHLLRSTPPSAAPSIPAAPTSSNVTNTAQSALNHLAEASAVGASALGKRRRKEQGAVAAPSSSVDDNYIQLQAHLQNWCDQIPPDSNEYPFRLEAKKRIETCYSKSLNTLDLYNLQLTSLPSLKDFSFPHIDDFNCGKNALTALPDLSTIMPNLMVLDASENQIEEFPEFSSVMKLLYKFAIDYNQLKILPDFSSKMPNLEEIDASNNKIEVFPEFSSIMSDLYEFKIDYNQLKTLPDLSTIMPNLMVLDASENQIEAFPEFSCVMNQLTTFDCTNNLISILPDFSSKMPNLEIFICAYNRIDVLPEFSSTMNTLKTFDCSGNFISILPDFSSTMPCLDEFNASENTIEELPMFTSIMYHLTTFNCSSNALVNLSDFSSKMPHLTDFNCSDNNLEALPNFSDSMSYLETFNCSLNVLASLPETMLSWRQLCTIDAEHNEFSSDYTATYQQQINQTRSRDPLLGPSVLFTNDNPSSLSTEKPLDEMIFHWLRIFQIAFPKGTHQSVWSTLDETWFPDSHEPSDKFRTTYKPLLDHENQKDLSTFLLKLLKIKDYKHKASRNNVIFKVQNFLKSAIENEVFKEHMFESIGEALSSCGDRVAFYFNRIEVQWHLDCKKDALSEVDLAKLLIGVKRIELLDQQAQGMATLYRLGDQIETLLYCQVELKDALKLPISTEGMLYPDSSGLDDEMLNVIKNAVINQTTSPEHIKAVLCESSYWIKRLQDNHKERFEAINEECQADLCSPDLEEPRQEHIELDRIKAIQEKQQQLQQGLVVELTQKWVDEHFSHLSSFLAS